MNWFKHDADASTDAKIKKLLIKYGAEGYAIYFHCLELIAGDINENNITFELEHDAEIIADNLKIKGTADKAGIDIVNDIMKYIISLDLFQESNGHIFCFKLLKRLDSSMTSNTKLRSLITSAKEHHDSVMTTSCKIRTEEIRTDNNIPEILTYWQTLYNQKTATTIMPNETAREQAFKLTQQVGDIELLKRCADTFFDDKQDWFFTQNKSGNNIKRVYYFKSFVSNITALIAVVQEKKAFVKKEEAKKIPRPPKCPTCGKPTIEYMYGGAGCKPCGVMFRYNDKWIREK